MKWPTQPLDVAEVVDVFHEFYHELPAVLTCIDTANPNVLLRSSRSMSPYDELEYMEQMGVVREWPVIRSERQ